MGRIVEKERPTQLQMEILVHILQHVCEHGYQPSIREMACSLGLTPRAIVGRLEGLQRRGLLECHHKQPRAIRLLKWKFEVVPHHD